jgi:hypothetical protein
MDMEKIESFLTQEGYGPELSRETLERGGGLSNTHYDRD